MGLCGHLDALRSAVVKKDGGLQILLANFLGTEQQKDIEAKTLLVEDFFRIKINVKAFDEAERVKQGKPPFDFKDSAAVFRAMADEFDIPYWAFCALKGVKLRDCTNTLVYQLKACNLHCPWCYVDDGNKNGKVDGSSRFFSISEIVDAYERERSSAPHCLRASGGEPTLAVEQWPALLGELERRSLSSTVFVQGDTNLTTGSWIARLIERGELDNAVLYKVAEHPNFGLLCSFKGTDRESFCAATGIPRPELHDEQFNSLALFVEAGIECYPFIYDPNPDTLESFMERGARAFGEGFWLKSWIFRLKLYSPERARLKASGIDPDSYQARLDENFARSEDIMRELIWKKYGLDYKAVPRTGIALKSKR